MKKCRKCNKEPENGYPKSRELKNDWICNTCSNKSRDLWLARKRLRDDISDELTSNKTSNPKCPVCGGDLRRSDSFNKVSWACRSCSDKKMLNKHSGNPIKCGKHVKRCGLSKSDGIILNEE